MPNTQSNKRPYRRGAAGRIKRAPEARLTPAELDALKSILKRRGESFSEWIVRHIGEDTNATN